MHLLLTWGSQFQKLFRQISHVCAHLPDTAVLIALTATMQVGLAYQSMCKFFGLVEGNYSNLHYDIQTIYR